MSENGTGIELKLPAITVLWDSGRQVVQVAWNPQELKSPAFVRAVLEMAMNEVDKIDRFQSMQIMAQKAAMAQQQSIQDAQILRNLRH